MRTNVVLVLALCALLPFLGQAITVECDLSGNACAGGGGTTIGSITRSMFYRVTLGLNEEIDYFHNGWFLDGSVNGWVSQGSDFIVIDASGADQGWLINAVSANEPYTNFVDHGAIASSIGNTDAILRWQENGAGSISNGAFYFGYNTTAPFATVGFLAAESGSTVLNENWSASVGQGLGPIHAPIPEPSTVLLLFAGSAVIGIVRRKVLR